MSPSEGNLLHLCVPEPVPRVSTLNKVVEAVEEWREEEMYSQEPDGPGPRWRGGEARGGGSLQTNKQTNKQTENKNNNKGGALPNRNKKNVHHRDRCC